MAFRGQPRAVAVATSLPAFSSIQPTMPCKALHSTVFVSLAAVLAAGGVAARWAGAVLLTGLCPWLCAGAGAADSAATLASPLVGQPAVAPAGAESRSSAATAQEGAATLSGRVDGMQGQARVVLSGGGAGCALEPGGGFGRAPLPQPRGVRMPYGVLAFSASGCSGSVTVQLTYPEPLPPSAQLWKLGPAHQGATTSTWFAWSQARFSSDRRTVTYTVEDNGIGDSDPAVGRITDPATVALVPVVAVPTPTDNTWALWVAAAILGLMVWLDWRGRRPGAAGMG